MAAPRPWLSPRRPLPISVLGSSSSRTAAASSAGAPNSASSPPQNCACSPCPTAKYCPTTCSRRTPTSRANGCWRSPSCRPCAAECCSSPSIPCCNAWPRCSTSRVAVSRWRSASVSPSRRSACDSPKRAIRASAKSRVRANTPCAARCSMCFRWVRTRRYASIFSTTRSRRFAVSIRRPNDRRTRSTRYACCRPAKCRSMATRCAPSDAAIARASRATRRAAPSIEA